MRTSTIELARGIGNAGRRRSFINGLIVATIATFMLASIAGPASAYAPSPSGSPGAISLNKTLGISGYSAYRVNSQGIIAYRSPATTGTQTLNIRWRVWQYQAGTWTVKFQRSVTYTVYANPKEGGRPPCPDG